MRKEGKTHGENPPQDTMHKKKQFFFYKEQKEVANQL
jgi:hypothetical protein